MKNDQVSRKQKNKNNKNLKTYHYHYLMRTGWSVCYRYVILKYVGNWIVVNRFEKWRKGEMKNVQFSSKQKNKE